MEVLEQPRCDVLAVHPLALEHGEALGDEPVVQAPLHLPVRRQRVGEHDARGIRAEPVPRDDDGGCLSRRLDPPRHLVPGVGEVEAGERGRAVAEHRHRQRLEGLEGARHVENRLDARTHDEDRRRGDHPEVRRHVEGRRCAAVHPAEPPRGEDADADLVGHRRGRRDGRRPVETEGDRDAQVAHRQLGDCRGRCRCAPARRAQGPRARRRPARRSSPARRLPRAPPPRSGPRWRCCRGAAARGRGSCSRGRRRRGPPRALPAPPSRRRRRTPATGSTGRQVDSVDRGGVTLDMAATLVPASAPASTRARGALAHPGQHVDEAARHPLRRGPDGDPGRAVGQPHGRLPDVLDDAPPLA